MDIMHTGRRDAVTQTQQQVTASPRQAPQGEAGSSSLSSSSVNDFPESPLRRERAQPRPVFIRGLAIYLYFLLDPRSPLGKSGDNYISLNVMTNSAFNNSLRRWSLCQQSLILSRKAVYIYNTHIHTYLQRWVLSVLSLCSSSSSSSTPPPHPPL